jgi:hypothetical protein
MEPDMRFEVGGRAEPLVAEGAFMRLFSRMYKIVLLKMR